MFVREISDLRDTRGTIDDHAAYRPAPAYPAEYATQ